jgi:hypothetical protein
MVWPAVELTVVLVLVMAMVVLMVWLVVWAVLVECATGFGSAGRSGPAGKAGERFRHVIK